MPITARVPPGRAGRIWLRRRLATARRGRDQLDRKLRILQPEVQRQRIRAARSHEEWERACAEVRRWTTRAALVSGQDGFRHAAARHPADVELRWATSMGVSYPAGASLTSRGKHTLTRVPRPGSLSASTLPPCCRTMP